MSRWRPNADASRSRRAPAQPCGRLLRRISMAEQTRINTKRQGSEILAVVGKFEPAVRSVAPDQLDGITWLGHEPQTHLFRDIPDRCRRRVWLSLVGSAEANDHAPRRMSEQLHAAAE